MMRSAFRVWIGALGLALTFTWGGQAQQAEARTFRMGFTPFPYEITLEAVQDVYATIGRDADLIAHHFDNGVPWPEAFSGEPFSDHLMGDWELRRGLTPEDMPVYLALTPVNFWRTGLALYHGEGEDLPLPAPWDSYPLDHPDVKTAYLNYVLRAVEYFQPTYLAIGIEVTLLLTNAPDQWAAYLDLHRHTYGGVKAVYPDLPVMASVVAGALLEGYTDDPTEAHLAGLEELLPYSDYFALSLYPYMTAYTTAQIPADLFDRLAALSDKPIAIAETGYPAQTFVVTIGGTEVSFDTDADKQNTYIRLLLDAAIEYEFEFVVNFVLRDYDAVLAVITDQAILDIAVVWQYIGLYDDDGTERAGLETWREFLALPLEARDE
jgi:hypothetical protein